MMTEQKDQQQTPYVTCMSQVSLKEERNLYLYAKAGTRPEFSDTYTAEITYREVIPVPKCT